MSVLKRYISGQVSGDPAPCATSFRLMGARCALRRRARGLAGHELQQGLLLPGKRREDRARRVDREGLRGLARQTLWAAGQAGLAPPSEPGER